MKDVGGRILIAEDNGVLSDVLSFNLQKAGFVVTVAENGLVAIEELKLAAFDLLITDYQMPVVDGAELCKAVRTELHLTDMPILMCSAKGLEINIEKLKSDFGISKLVFKPFSMREIVSAAQSLIAEKSVPIY
jgi:CheY-like chemotaxis protein